MDVTFHLSTSSLLCMEPSYRQNNKGYQILHKKRIKINFTILIIWYPVLFFLYLSSPILLIKLFVLKTYLWMSRSIWDMSQLSRIIVVAKIKQKLHISVIFYQWMVPTDTVHLRCRERDFPSRIRIEAYI